MPHSVPGDFIGLHREGESKNSTCYFRTFGRAGIMGAVELYPGHEFCVESERGTSNLQSILDLLALGLQFRDNVTLKVTGPKEQEAGEKIAELFEHVYDFHS